jgi:2-methylisocitrate lyase-like PEP mutase family enzyme
MSSKFQKFKALHHANDLFVLPNAWDARSAIIFQEKQFPAIGTSSAAVANSLGYEDGENMPFADYLFVIKRILASVQIPLTVDMEMGYGETNDEIVANITKLVELGVVGINIEDSMIQASKRSLRDGEKFGKTIEYMRNKLQSQKMDLFINIRCDTYILNVDNKQKETISRLERYESTGADGIFLPCISNEEDIVEAVANTKLPLNVMVVPGLPDLARLNELGVKRVSMGPFMFQKVYNGIGNLSQAITASKSVSPILS